jgi:hypothetical protein
MTKLRITADGRICGLWDDNVPLGELGAVRVERASHVEFDNGLQSWTVRPTAQSGARYCPIVHQSRSRRSALVWEHENFQPGGPFWRPLTCRLDDESDLSPFNF